MPSKYTAFRCPADLLDLAQKRAKAERRSLSNYIVTLIAKDVKSPESTSQITEAEDEIPQEESPKKGKTAAGSK